MSIESPVKALNAEVARKIAAGEVIDRPASIVRELMDNAIDSKADSITVEISGGGIEKIRVVDNGCGMTKEDLINSARPHSTSKIRSENDLLNLSTLGFRGEALASIAAVSRLSITSGGWKMKVSITEDHIIEKTPEFSGTIVQSEGLFENIPARRVFLKREATEAILCKNMFTEKAIPQFQKAFKLVVNGQIKMNLPKNQTLKERYLEAREIKENPALFYQVEGKSPDKKDDWSFSIIIGEPGIRRNNKKDIEIFLNGRKIQEYSLVQAIEYGSKGYFPNGTFPVAAAFIQMDPAQVDFNIHPAKKEVKFKDINGLHHGISSTLSAFWQNYTNKTMKSAIKSVNSEPSDLWKSTAFPKYSAGTAERGGISPDTGSRGLSTGAGSTRSTENFSSNPGTSGHFSGAGGSRSTTSDTSERAVIGRLSAGKTGSSNTETFFSHAGSSGLSSKTGWTFASTQEPSSKIEAFSPSADGSSSNEDVISSRTDGLCSKSAPSSTSADGAFPKTDGPYSKSDFSSISADQASTKTSSSFSNQDLSFSENGSNLSQKEEKTDYIREKMQKIIASYNMESESNESVCNFSNNDKEKESHNINYSSPQTSRFSSPLSTLLSSSLSNKNSTFKENIFSSQQTVSDEKKSANLSSLEEEYKKDSLEKGQNLTLQEENNSSENESNTKELDFHSFHLLGSALGTFIIAEYQNALYIIDKHAAHERMLFDKIMNEKSATQNLLIPYIIETKDQKEDEYLESIKDELKKAGFTANKKSEGTWEFTTLNERWKGSEEDLEHALFDKKVRPEDLIYSIAAMTACKAAVKDGWTLADSTAEEIAKGALALKDPHCPHGRPCYFTLTREELFNLVRRTE